MRLKICCIQDYHEIQLALKYGATEVGLVGSMPSGPGPISDVEIRRLSEQASHRIKTVLLTSQNEAHGIVNHYKKVKTTSIQLVRELPVSEIEKIKSALPNIELFQVVHVYDETAIQRAKEYAPVADVILLDSGNPKNDVYGGTGQTHNWEISKALVKAVNKPVFLAGGLNPQNVRSAIREVRPGGVDICSGLRSGGRLVEAKLQSFSDQIKLSL